MEPYQPFPVPVKVKFVEDLINELKGNIKVAESVASTEGESKEAFEDMQEGLPF